MVATKEKKNETNMHGGIKWQMTNKRNKPGVCHISRNDNNPQQPTNQRAWLCREHYNDRYDRRRRLLTMA